MDQLEQRLQRIELLLVIGSKNVLDTNEVAAMLGVRPDYIRRLASTRAIPHYKKSNRIYFKKTEIEDWQLGTRVPTDIEIASKAAIHCLNRK
ncbi:MAG: helix-turn-helix domain-containing protein [Staphylococcus sp.]|nr:helix-turn-helix domain-containing protein [Staphylococcus sp.]